MNKIRYFKLYFIITIIIKKKFTLTAMFFLNIQKTIISLITRCNINCTYLKDLYAVWNKIRQKSSEMFMIYTF